MWRSLEPRFDVATALFQGARDYQEDAVITDFPYGSASGLAVLSDGMGGHAAGDIASKIVLTEVFSELKFQAPNFAGFETEIPDFLEEAAEAANTTLSEHVEQNPETEGMGATLLSVVVVENRMYWLSVGDSPLYLQRNGHLSQINEDHSYWPHIADQVARGLIDEETALRHPDRNSLTSVILGGAIPKVDLREVPYDLCSGDIVVLASDGLQYLDERVIQDILYRKADAPAQEIAGTILAAIEDQDDPEQDNVSLAVVKVNSATSAAKPSDLIQTLPPSNDPHAPAGIAAASKAPPATDGARHAAMNVPRPLNPHVMRRATT